MSYVPACSHQVLKQAFHFFTNILYPVLFGFAVNPKAGIISPSAQFNLNLTHIAIWVLTFILITG